MRLDVVPDDLLPQDVPSDEVRILPDDPTATKVLFPYVTSVRVDSKT